MSPPSSPALLIAMVLASRTSSASNACVPDEGLSSSLLLQVQTWNCRRVNNTISEFDDLVKANKLYATASWQNKSQYARTLCAKAASLHNRQGVIIALQAWGSVMMDGRECCSLAHPPYCYSTGISYWGHVLPFGAAILIICIAIISPKLCRSSVSKANLVRTTREGAAIEICRDRRSPVGPAATAAAADTVLPPTRAASPPTHAFLVDIHGDSLEHMWGREENDFGGQTRWVAVHSLGALPHAQNWAKRVKMLFMELQTTFQFQEDSVRNQFEHLLSLWRSVCGMVGDEALAKGSIHDRISGAVNEDDLLRSGLKDLHAELLEGFLYWRRKISAYDAAKVPLPKTSDIPSLGSAPARAISATADTTAKVQVVQICEIATYLLVWGEAGNLRFMPEVIYFITELALAAQAQDLLPLYSEREYASTKFLAEIIRPIYNVIFDEHYERVTVDANGKDSKQLRENCKKFLPADCANYDDWNELFADPPRLVETLVFATGEKLFATAHCERFSRLRDVDWKASLAAAKTKTHREVHSVFGVFAATHRVWLLHGVLFFIAICIVSSDHFPDAAVAAGQIPVIGKSRAVQFAAIGLLSSAHAALWKFSRWITAGHAVRHDQLTFLGGVRAVGSLLLWVLPLLSYGLVRYVEHQGGSLRITSFFSIGLLETLIAHFGISSIGLGFLLLWPSYSWDKLWILSRISIGTTLGRSLFWLFVLGVKFTVSMQIIRTMYNASVELDVAQFQFQTIAEIKNTAFSPMWDNEFIEAAVLFSTAFLIFIADTQMWFVLCCSVLGVIVALAKRKWEVKRFLVADAVANIPELLSQKVLMYDWKTARSQQSGYFAPKFPMLWDRIVEWMFYEDKLDVSLMRDLSFYQGREKTVGLDRLLGPLCRPASGESKKARTTATSTMQVKPPQRRINVLVPHIFRDVTYCERVVRRDLGLLTDSNWPTNPDVVWRLLSLSRGLQLEIPHPFRIPYIPGLTVLIPHYGETIITTPEELEKSPIYGDGRYNKDIKLVKRSIWFYEEFMQEFKNFTARRGARGHVRLSPWAGGKFEHEDMKIWASMRSQTLYRTVAGMMLYHPALEAHCQIQSCKSSKMTPVWKASECFSCIVTMQMYAFFSKQQLEQTNQMLNKFPDSLKIAYIGYEDLPGVGVDNIHPNQQRRYYSNFIDKHCRPEDPNDPKGKRKPSLRIELPGYPILGDGKGDNQNHAIQFSRGQFIQCIDANQGAYFEQMLLLPCVLGEFRKSKEKPDGSKKIIGLPEHITSDFGSIGDFAASAEVAFGTILQRTYAALGARMHYGHPDIMNKVYMMQQGGVSKATKTVNLSEDIFAGMDFTLRGQGRNIYHREYFHLAKGRDLGFNTVLMFFSKLAAGTGEQLLSRQMMRLGQVLPLPEFLAFFYAHGGYYLNQFFVSKSTPMIVFLWLFAIVDDSEENLCAAQIPTDRACALRNAQIMAELLANAFSWLVLLFLTAQVTPLFVEICLQRGFLAAINKIFKQMITLAPLHFVFQAKLIGIYVTGELRYGGASYVSTGRGLPIDRKPFIGPMPEGGLYMDFAVLSLYDGARLMAATGLVYLAEETYRNGATVSLKWWYFVLSLTIVSWLYAPFIFNPYQFSYKYFCKDLGSWAEFFFAKRGQNWVKWYEEKQLKPRSGVRLALTDLLGWMIIIAAWYTTLNEKMHFLSVLLSGQKSMLFNFSLAILPPVFFSICFISLASIVYACYVKIVQLRGPSPGLALYEDSYERATRVLADAYEGFMETQATKLPLWLMALCIVVLDVLEAALSLKNLWIVGWYKTFVAGLVLKYYLMALLMLSAEVLLRFRWTCHFIQVPVRLWLHAHRFTIDFLVSSLIFWTLAPFVLFDYFREKLCEGCSLHQLLIMRRTVNIRTQRDEMNLDPSRASRRNTNLSFTLDGAAESDVESADEDARGDTAEAGLSIDDAMKLFADADLTAIPADTRRAMAQRLLDADAMT